MEDVDPNVEALVDEIRRPASTEHCKDALEILRKKTKDDSEVRKALHRWGAVDALSPLTRSSDLTVMEHAVTVIHNLSLSESLHEPLLEAGVIADITYVMEHGNDVSQSNAAATLFHILYKGTHVKQVAQEEALFPPLINLLWSPNRRVQKDAAYALYYLTISSVGRVTASTAGAVPALMAILEQSSEGMEAKAMAVVANLAKCHEGRAALEAWNGVAAIGDVLEGDDSRAKEDATATLLLLVQHNGGAMDRIVREGIMPALNSLAKSGSSSLRAKQKAAELVRLWRARRRNEGSDVSDSSSRESLKPR